MPWGGVNDPTPLILFFNIVNSDYLNQSRIFWERLVMHWWIVYNLVHVLKACWWLLQRLLGAWIQRCINVCGPVGGVCSMVILFCSSLGTVGVNSAPASLVSQRQSRSFWPVVFTEKNSVLTACVGWHTHTCVQIHTDIQPAGLETSSQRRLDYTQAQIHI